MAIRKHSKTSSKKDQALLFEDVTTAVSSIEPKKPAKTMLEQNSTPVDPFSTADPLVYWSLIGMAFARNNPWEALKTSVQEWVQRPMLWKRQMALAQMQLGKDQKVARMFDHFVTHGDTDQQPKDGRRINLTR
ncbi:MAG: hypothetical protein K2X01_01960 [Cyanobacteria bacterium]|nr:hypothetical protein [Cyanobacteriota bacterium]